MAAVAVADWNGLVKDPANTVSERITAMLLCRLESFGFHRWKARSMVHYVAEADPW